MFRSHTPRMQSNEPLRQRGRKTEAAHQLLQKYISPNQLARRWCVSRSTADRIARSNSFTRFLPGCGRNGTVRYLMEEVMCYEQSRLITTHA